MPEIRSVIHGITPERAEKMKHGGRYEVVFDHLSGGADGLEAHFRLVEEDAAQRITVGGLGGTEPVMELAVPADELERRALYPDEIRREDVIVSYRRAYGSGPEYHTRSGRRLTEAEVDRLTEQERREFPVYAYGTGIHERLDQYQQPVVTTEYPAAELFMARASDLLAAMIGLMKISPLVLGIPSGNDPLNARIYRHLTGQEVGTMGKHGDGKGADTKAGGSKGGGAHEKGGKGK